MHHEPLKMTINRKFAKMKNKMMKKMRRDRDECLPRPRPSTDEKSSKVMRQMEMSMSHLC